MNDRQDCQTEITWLAGMFAAGCYWWSHSDDEFWDGTDAQVMDGLCDGVFEYCPQLQEVRLKARG